MCICVLQTIAKDSALVNWGQKDRVTGRMRLRMKERLTNQSRSTFSILGAVSLAKVNIVPVFLF